MRKYFLFFILLGLPLCAYGKGTDIAADNLTRDAKGVITATGDVEIKRKGETLKADKVLYDTKKKHIQAIGHVEIISPKAHIIAKSGSLSTTDKTGELNDAYITLPTGERIQSDHLKRLSDIQFNADNISFTTCPPDAEAWGIRASHIEVNQEEGVMIAHHARFEIAGVPVLYSPYWQHPLRRKSGLLIPSFGSSSARGSEYALPLYWAGASNWDATLTPRWMTARGLMGDVEVRHAAQMGNETIRWAGLKDTKTHTYRQYIQADIKHQLPAHWQFYTHVDHVSDHDYLADFSTERNSVSTRYLTSNAGLSWRGENADILLSGQYQQDITLANDDTVLQILPRLESHYALPISNMRLHLDQQTTLFNRVVGVDGWRVAAHPWLELPLRFEQGAISTTLQGGLRTVRYWQQGIVNPQKQQRTSYDASFEGRMDFEAVNDSLTWQHAFSPIIRYDIATAPDQGSLVNFDSGFSQLTLQNLMHGNRFTGQDRFERMNRISILIEQSLQHKSSTSTAARTIATARIGVAYDLLRKSVDTALQTAPTRPFSNVVGDISISPVQGVRLYADGQYDPSNKFWATAQAGLQLQHTSGHHLNVRWQRIDGRYQTASEIISGDISIHFAPRWRAFAQTQYDAKLKLYQQTSAGIHYQHACWDFKVEAYRTLNNGSANTANIGYSFLLGFKGLGSVGDS